MRTWRKHKRAHGRPRAGYASLSDPPCLRGFRGRGDPRLPRFPPQNLHGKEGVDGSSPSEGSHESPAKRGGLCFPDSLHFVQCAQDGTDFGILIRDFFVVQRAGLLKWSALTRQSAQIDTGYIAQHMASVVSRARTRLQRKGIDLADGSEAKSAAILSGVDRPR
jgi:hypothetical protein